MRRIAFVTLSVLSASIFACSAAPEEGVGSDTAAATTGAETRRECVAETGQAVGTDAPARERAEGEIAAYWRANGRVRVLGLPITPVLDGTDEQGKPMRAQWFERARLEFHPSLYDQHHPKFGNGVLEGRLGVEYMKKVGLADANGKPLFACGVTSPRHRADQTEFHTETGCTIFGLSTQPDEITLSDGRPVVVDAQPNFLDYYRRNGGLEHFGHPLSEQIDMEGVDADKCERELQQGRASEGCLVLAHDPQVKPYRLVKASDVTPGAPGDFMIAEPGSSKYVQYFERGRLEYQPANIEWSEHDVYGTKRTYAGRTYFVGAREPQDDYTVQLGLFGQGLAPHGDAKGDAFNGWSRCR